MHFFRFPRQSPVRPPQGSVQRRALWIVGAAAPIFLGLSLLPIARAAQDDVPAAKQSDATSATTRIEEGKKIFHDRCLSCHNKAAGDTSPFGPPNLHGIFREKPTITTAEATTIIAKGKNSMPGWEGVLTKSEISSVIAYLRTQ